MNFSASKKGDNFTTSQNTRYVKKARGKAYWDNQVGRGNAQLPKERQIMSTYG